MKNIISATIFGFLGFTLASCETEGILEIYDHEPAFTSTIPGGSNPEYEFWQCYKTTKRQHDEQVELGAANDHDGYAFKEDCDCMDIGYPDANRGMFGIEADGSIDDWRYNGESDLTAPPSGSQFQSKYHSHGE